MEKMDGDEWQEETEIMAYADSQARGPVRATAASLHQSHSNVGFEPRLRPTLLLIATLDP